MVDLARLPFALLLLAAAVAAGGASPPPSRGPDSDGDGISDADEDTNHNGVVDPGESDPKKIDTDGDNVPDDVERHVGSDPLDANDVPTIPEPLLIDLVRNLGSRKGELEVNVLAATSYRRSPVVVWGPEIEYVPVPGLGLELELPLTDRVEAIKPGAQLTVASFAHRRLEVGVLTTHTQFLHDPASFTTLSAVTGVRFSTHVQALTIVGPTLTTRRGRDPALGGILSPSVYYQASRLLTMGVELGYRVTAGEPSAQLVLPQVHLNLNQHVTVQAGMGGTHEGDGAIRPFSAIRVCWER